MLKIALATLLGLFLLSAQADDTNTSFAQPSTLKKRAQSVGYSGYCVGYNAANGNWQVFSYPQPPSMEYINSLSSPTKEMMLNLRNSYDYLSACRTEVVTNVDIPASLKGGSLYFGYGISLEEMVQSGRFTLIYGGL